VTGTSAEVLLISALINNQAVGDERLYAITEHHMSGYHDEYCWLVNYLEVYGSQPTREIFAVKFPAFPWVPHTDIRAAADLVHEGVNRRRLSTAIAEATQLIGLNEPEAAYQALLSAEPRRALARPKSFLTNTDYLTEWEHRPYTVEVPYPTLQRYTRGIAMGNLWYLAGRPGQGKSAHLANITKHGIDVGNRALFYSLEMSEEEVRARFHAAWARDLGYSQITTTALRDRNVDRELYRKFHGELSERLSEAGGALDVLTPADGPVSPSVVAARASEYHLVVIDYVSLMAADGGGAGVDDWRVLAKISNSLKQIALATQTGILCAAQINRDGETGNLPPKVKNLAQSDALGQDGDVVVTMRAKPHNVATVFSLEKNRHGPSGVRFYTTFDPNTGTYTEISGDQAEDLAINAEAMTDEPGPTAPPTQLRVVKSKDEL